MKIIGTQEELKWVRRALANNCEGCIFEERCNQNASEELKKHGKTLTSCEEFMARQITFVSEERTKTTKQDIYTVIDTIYSIKQIDSTYILCYYTDIVLFYAFPGGGSCFGILRNPVHEEEKQELFPA